MLTRTSIYGGSTFDDEPDFVYFDCQVASIRTEETGITDPQVRFSETRSQPILADCSKYYMSITRFTMDGCGSDLPMWIPTIQTLAQQQASQAFTQFDPNMTIYGVSIGCNIQGVNAGTTTYLEWTSEIAGARAYSQKYYYCYTYSHFVDMFNTAIKASYANVVSQLASPPVTKCPYLAYNSSTNLFSLYCDSNGFGPDRTSTTESFFITLDPNLYQLLRNFNNVYTPNNAPLTNVITVRNYLNNIFTGADGTKYYVVTQDFPSTDAIWSPVASIVFTSSMLPIIPEQLGAPIVFGDGSANNPSTSQANFQQTITDIALPLQRSSDYKGFVQYGPVPYRMIAMSNSKQEIRQLDISVFWKDRQGILHPMTMANGAMVSIKILFRKRSLGI